MPRADVDVPLLFELWVLGAPVEEIADRLGVCQSTMSVLRRRYKLPPRVETTVDEIQPGDPTVEEIYAAAAEIRKTWPPSRFRRQPRVECITAPRPPKRRGWHRDSA